MKKFEILMNAEGWILLNLTAENEEEAREKAESGDWEDKDISRNEERYQFESIEEVK